MVSLHQSEVCQRHGGGQLPAFTSSDEGSPQLLDQVQELVFVGEGATTVGCARVLPIQVQTVKVVLV